MSKKPLKKSIAIIGEGLTEWMYFDHIRKNWRYSFSLKPDLPKHASYLYIFAKAKELCSKGFDIAFCVLDIDTILRENTLEEFRKACKQLPNRIVPITSNPCIEIWFLMHFMKTPQMRSYESYEALKKVLRIHLKNYDKTEEYLTSSAIFSKLEENNGLETALTNSKAIFAGLYQDKDVSQSSFSEVSLLIEHLDMCKGCNFRKDCKVCAMKLSTFF